MPLRLMTLFLAGWKLELELVAERDGGSSLHVYGGQFGKQEMIDVLWVGAIQYKRLS
ncbi:hypothetical protein MTR67_012911 [Solanum verrucosum]|uniref:Uncharacterized protein n=1 Tax=Solanum verrucosum TaxID=315347 RepID=A0AAF0QFC0_SOLVR|nr:hypothetical protein MTR67_012911 [Solanum verrucosum]